MPRRVYVLVLLALIAVQLPWLWRPVDIDEANFLVLARGAARDAWRPHDIAINWQGTEQRAFDVLSNPPGIAWWLAPLVGAATWVQRAWMLPWSALALSGAWRLGRRFWDAPLAGALVLLCSPIVVLSATALLPDAPLYACVLAGMGLYVEGTDRGRDVRGAALLVGCASLFRYSGICLPPLLAVYAWSRGRSPWNALWGWVPLALLGLHDLSAYGAWHLAAMGKFQAVSETGEDWLHKGVAAVAMLGGAAALPLFRGRWAALGGAVVGGAVGSAYGVTGAAFGAAGGAALGQVAGAAVGRGSGVGRAGDGRAGDEDADDALLDARWLGLWAGGGLLFLVTLRFMATRYWLPFLPAVLLSLPLRRDPRPWVAGSLSLGALLLADASFQARGSERLADEVAALGTGVFTGHWGWQWAMEAHGWRALDEGERAPPGALVAMPRQAWPQAVDVACTEVLWAGDALPPLPWLPRAYSEAGHANLHANWIAGPPMTRTVAPWTFADDPYEHVRVCAR